MKTNLIDVTLANVDQTGFFCYMSKRKSEGYKRKLQRLNARFDEGLKIKMLPLPARGFIESIPGEFAWRGINAKGFIVIHCLWVVGQSKGKGYSKLLLDECIADAKKSNMDGVAMVTSEEISFKVNCVSVRPMPVSQRCNEHNRSGREGYWNQLLNS